jgi:hypothetical protein
LHTILEPLRAAKQDLPTPTINITFEISLMGIVERF